MRKCLLACVLLLTGCAGLSERAADALNSLDVPTGDVVKVLAEAPKLQLIIEMADIDNNGRLDAAPEWFAFLSGIVTLVQAR